MKHLKEILRMTMLSEANYVIDCGRRFNIEQHHPACKDCEKSPYNWQCSAYYPINVTILVTGEKESGQ